MRFVGKSRDEVEKELRLRLEESDLRSAFFILTSLEARLVVDFEFRCKQRLKDPLSAHLRQVQKERKEKWLRFDEDILEGWKRYGPDPPQLISELRRAFKFRHWLAHGRYWTPKHGYDFLRARLTAESIISGLTFAS